ncbi:LysR family transcriptional regulator [Saccharophagus degradans]|uniref:LysR family transcriptional regulator n=1 Tax=Saccharophagus degradans TaxID=86304 RepID=A0AAW7X858_9GAMM|nr:LysR family transcriptional regulator [Saccharophagus degradans]MDO6423858.1 LysR family transcriptional regulator [Saccharophagus degradans]MDO6607937.1 LysR family transcriptional regulator [Saccharophagus degradans]
MIPKISLEQWAAFKAVVDEGSFAKAAEALNKSQSAVSYAIAKLEEQLPTPVLTQQGRKAVLTEAGKQLYRHATDLLAQAATIENTAKYLASGWESEVTIAVDALFSMGAVFCALQHFSVSSPQTRLRILETTLSGTEEALLGRKADLVLTGTIPPGFSGTRLGEVSMIPVVGQQHPLVQLMQQSGPVTEQELGRHRQIVLRDTGTKREQSSGWLRAEQRWTVTHAATSIEAVKNGLGFAFLPKEKILQELEAGSLIEVALAEKMERFISLYLIKTERQNAGPATQAIAQQLIERYGKPQPKCVT